MTLVRRRRAAGLDAAMLHFLATGCPFAPPAVGEDLLRLWDASDNRAALAELEREHGAAIRAAVSKDAEPWIARKLRSRGDDDTGTWIGCGEHDAKEDRHNGRPGRA